MKKKKILGDNFVKDVVTGKQVHVWGPLGGNLCDAFSVCRYFSKEFAEEIDLNSEPSVLQIPNSTVPSHREKEETLQSSPGQYHLS